MLGAHERLMYYYSRSHPRHFCIIAQIKADRSGSDYLRALKAVQAKHPLMRANIDQNSAGNPYFYECGVLQEPTILSRDQHWHWTEVVERELETDFSEAEALFRAVVLYDAFGATIVFTYHHAISDGVAATAVVEDLLRALAGDTLAPLGVPCAVDGFLNVATVAGSAGSDDQDWAQKQGFLEIARRPLWRSFDGDEVSIRTAALDTTAVDRFRMLARLHASTVNSAICVALATAAHEQEGKSDYSILSAIDVRPLLEMNRTDCAMRAIAGTITMSNIEEDFWVNARRHSDGMKRLRSPGYVEQTTATLGRLLSANCSPALASGLLGSLSYDAVVSNLGALPIRTRIADVELEAIWGPVGQARLKDERFVGVCTATGEMRFIEAVPGHQISILHEALEILRTVCR